MAIPLTNISDMHSRSRTKRSHRKLIGLENLESRQMLAVVTYNVTQLVDNWAPGQIDPVTTLSGAITDANAKAGTVPGDTYEINFDLPQNNTTVTVQGELPEITAPKLRILGRLKNITVDTDVILQGTDISAQQSLRYDGDANSAASGRFEIRDTRIRGFDDAIQIVRMGANDQVLINNVESSSNRGNGIRVFEGPHGTSGDLDIFNSQFYSNTGAGIRIDGTISTSPPVNETPSISNVLVGTSNGTNDRSNGGVGIQLGMGANGYVMDNLQVYDNSDVGIYFRDGATGNRVGNGNEITSDGNVAVLIASAASDNFVIGSTLTTDGRSGIRVASDAGAKNWLINNDYVGVGSALPIDILGDGVLNSDGELSPGGFLSRPAVVVDEITIIDSQWRIPVDLKVANPGKYKLVHYEKTTSGWEQVSTSGIQITERNLTGNKVGVPVRQYYYATLSKFTEGATYGWQLYASGTTDTDYRNSSEIHEWTATDNAEGPQVQPGDYNRDSLVNAADYTVFRDAYSQVLFPFTIAFVPTNTGADGNGDGQIDDSDYDIWIANYGAGSNTSQAQIALAKAKAIGDYNQDGVVDDLDRLVWGETFGSRTELRADGNSDGVIDGLDFFIWADQFGSTLASPQFQSATPTQKDYYLATVTTDEVDGDTSIGDLSLREAVKLANSSIGQASVLLPSGRYVLDRTGSESNDATYNDLDINGQVQIVGEGAGLSVIDVSSLSGVEDRAFDVGTAGASLELKNLTVANGSGSIGQVARVAAGTSLDVIDTAIVNHATYIGGVAIEAVDADVVIRGSVFTNNDNTGTIGGAAIRVQQTTGGSASVTVGDSVFAYNIQPGYYAGYDTQKAVAIIGSVSKTNDGNNLYDDAAGGFFDTTTGVGDHLGSPDYVVTTIADTFDHSDDLEYLSVREAVDLANLSSGQNEIWLPAWDFVLTRDRVSFGAGSATDTDVAFGDLDIKDQLVVRGVQGLTSVSWKTGVVDSVFDLLGDYGNSGSVDQDVNAADYTVWNAQNGTGSGTSVDWEQYAADGDDDGDVDAADYALWQAYYGNSLDLFDVA